jgi:hypothetical protein
MILLDTDSMVQNSKYLVQNKQQISHSPLTPSQIYHFYLTTISFLYVSFAHMRYTRGTSLEKIFFPILERVVVDMGKLIFFDGVVQKKNRNGFFSDSDKKVAQRR